MSSDAEATFLSRLKQGPSFLLLGQSYLKIQASEDSLLTLILRKYPPSAAGSSTYFDLLAGAASEDRDSAMAWIEERCRTLSVPAWLDLVAAFPWNGVYSSAIDSIWPRAFRSEWRELQSILEEKYKPRDPRNRSVLHCTFLWGGQRNGAVPGGQNLVGHVRIAVPFPPPAGSPEPDPIAQRHQRVILSIGSQRLAFDFYHQVTELNPAPAPVIPVDRSKPPKARKPRK